MLVTTAHAQALQDFCASHMARNEERVCTHEVLLAALDAEMKSQGDDREVAGTAYRMIAACAAEVCEAAAASALFSSTSRFRHSSDDPPISGEREAWREALKPFQVRLHALKIRHGTDVRSMMGRAWRDSNVLNWDEEAVARISGMRPDFLEALDDAIFATARDAVADAYRERAFESPDAVDGEVFISARDALRDLSGAPVLDGSAKDPIARVLDLAVHEGAASHIGMMRDMMTRVVDNYFENGAGGLQEAVSQCWGALERAAAEASAPRAAVARADQAWSRVGGIISAIEGMVADEESNLEEQDLGQCLLIAEQTLGNASVLKPASLADQTPEEAFEEQSRAIAGAIEDWDAIKRSLTEGPYEDADFRIPPPLAHDGLEDRPEGHDDASEAAEDAKPQRPSQNAPRFGM